MSKKMPAEKTTITRTIMISVATSLGVTIVLLACCFVLLYELVRPLNIATTDVGARMTSSSNRVFDGDDIFISNDSSNRGHHSRRRYSSHRTSDGKNSNNNNDFDMSGKEVDNTLTGRSNDNSISRSDIGTSSISRNTKLIHSSFRIEQDVVKSLERAATTRDMSLSSLVNKILKNYVTSEMFFEELGFLLVSKNFLRKTFEGLDQKQIEDLGTEYGLTIAKEYISFFYPQVNVDTLIQFIEIWFKRFQSCHHRVGENDNYVNNKLNHYFTVNHDINMNFSLALQSILAGLIEPIIKNRVEFGNVTPNTITFSFAVFRE